MRPHEGPSRDPGTLGALLSPRSVAVIGASSREGHFGNQPLRNLRHFGYPGSVVAVNPSRTEIEGFPCVPSVDHLPDGLDHAVVVTRAENCPEIVDACRAKGVKTITVVASGFAETGTQSGIALQRSLERALVQGAMRMLGPNTLGCANFNERCVPFVSGNIPMERTRGGVAIVSQSGGIGFTILNRAWSAEIGVGYLVVAGNELDISIGEAAWHLVGREDVEGLICYVEAVRDAPALLTAVAAARAREIPIVLVKGGRSDAGRRAASAHTGALATSGIVFDGVLRQAGAIVAGTLDEAIAAVAVSSAFGRRAVQSIGVCGLGGGVSVVMADQFENAQLPIPPPGPSTVADLAALLPDVTASNPLDTGGQVLSVKGEPLLQHALTRFARDPAYDALVVVCMPWRGVREAAYQAAIVGAAAEVDKPWLVLQYGAPPMTVGMTTALRAGGIRVVDPPEVGIAGLRLWFEAIHNRAERRLPVLSLREEGEMRANGALSAAVQEMVHAARQSGRESLTERDAGCLLELAGLPAPRSVVATSPDVAAEFTRELGLPVALKALSQQVTHRARAGAILLRIVGPDDAAAGWKQIAGRVAAIPGAVLDGVLVQEIVVPGTELFVGAVRDPAFGLVCLLGVGGLHAEALRAVSAARAPVDDADITRMLKETGLGTAFTANALRGIGRAVWAVAEVARADAAIAAVEVNPLVVQADGACLAVDALVVLSSPPTVPRRLGVRTSAAGSWQQARG